MSGTDFWSRRRAAVRAEAEAETRAETEAAEAAEQSRLEEKSDEEVLEELGLPDPDTLEAGDDVSAFMARAVPERLRRRALRRLWRLNPVLANVDGLVDYGEDFTDAAMAVDAIETAYQVGKGMLGHIRHLAEQAEADAQDSQTAAIPPPEPEEPAPQTDRADMAGRDALPSAAAEGAEPPQTSPAPEAPTASEPEISRPRRMRFAFDDEELKVDSKTGDT